MRPKFTLKHSAAKPGVRVSKGLIETEKARARSCDFAKRATINPKLKGHSKNPTSTARSLDEVEDALEALKVAYDRYFFGIDRVPPYGEHERVERQVKAMMASGGGATAVRFRAQGIKSRFISYKHHWTRVMRQIEEGTYKRVLAESKRREFLARSRSKESRDSGSDETALTSEFAANRASQDKNLPKRSVPQLPPGVDSKSARNLFKQFVAAKRSVGDQTDGITYGALVSKLAREVPKLREKHGDRVRFEVAIVEGRVQLRARVGTTG